MAKDVNIPIKAEGAEKAKQQIDDVTRSVSELGEKTERAGKRQSEGVDKASESLSNQQKLVRDLTSKVMGMFGIWKGIDLVVDGLDKMAERLRRIRDLQSEINSNALSLMEAGQAFEVQTGSVGKQKEWASLLAELRTKGRLGSVGDALQIATSFDIATGGSGGVGNPENQDVLKGIVPMFGAAMLNGSQSSGFIKYAAAAGISPTQGAYSDFFAKVMTGYRTSQSTDFGQYITGLQSGTTGMLKQGASADSAISVYSTALSVAKNEAEAATLTEQMSRLSSGAYEKPRQAMEQFSGRNWETLSPDEQMNVLLAYTNTIPENKRIQVLTSQGFSPELSSGLSKIASPTTMKILEETRAKVSSASGVEFQKQIEAFGKSPVGVESERLGKKDEDVLELQDKVGGWQARLKSAEDYVSNLAAEGKDSILTPDDAEAGIYAYQSMSNELDLIIKEAQKKGDRETVQRAKSLQFDLGRYSRVMGPQVDDKIPVLSSIQDYRREKAFNMGPAIEEQLGSLREKAGITIINNHYDYSNHLNRSEGNASPRIEPE